jgi:anti-sigma regulatory factor (Ser/Thr protein kinase)
MIGGSGAVSTPCGDGVRHDVTELDSGAATAYHSWPLRTYLELAALPTAVPCARRHAKLVAMEWGLSRDRGDTAELIVSELVTNAVLASRGLMSPVVRLWLISDGQWILIQVWDGSEGMPVRSDAGPDAESGRGLMLVDALAKRWDAYAVDGGKVVSVVV